MTQIHWAEKTSLGRIAVRFWKNAYSVDNPPRGFVWIIHGLGEHSGRYDEWARFLTQFGFDVVAPDLPGHGLTAKEGNLRKLESMENYGRLLEELLLEFLYHFPCSERSTRLRSDFFLFGHSMGALLGLQWILNGRGSLPEEIQFAKKAVISAPPLKLRLPVPAWKKRAARLLHRLQPDLKLSNEISIEDLSYDQLNQVAYERDPLVHPHASPRLFLSLEKTAAEIRRKASDVELPVFFVVGEDDPIVDPDAIEEFYRQTRTHKRFLKVPETRHESYNDLRRDLVYGNTVEWLLK